MVFCDILITIVLSPFITYGLFYAIFYLRKKSIQNKTKKWTIPSKNRVILHGVPRLSNIPTLSPFVLKLETYLKAAKIPYIFDSEDPIGVKRKTPWISYNGQHIGDSHLIIQFLNEEFNVDFSKGLLKYSQAELGAAHAFRIMLEEHYFPGFSRWLWLDGFHYQQHDLSGREISEPNLLNTIQVFPLQKVIQFMQWLTGFGLHTREEFSEMMKDDLKNLSSFLGDKKFLLGDYPVEGDFTAFAFIAGTILKLKYSPYQTLIKDELHNLTEYFERTKSLFWPDWNEIIQK